MEKALYKIYPDIKSKLVHRISTFIQIIIFPSTSSKEFKITRFNMKESKFLLEIPHKKHQEQPLYIREFRLGEVMEIQPAYFINTSRCL